jgi:hypothetical protein
MIAASWSPAGAAASASDPEVTAAKPEPTHHDPAWIVQRAWSTFRLPRLQELIRQTIADLHSLNPRELLGREVVVPEGSDCDPVAEALKACCEELRDASGMAGAAAERATHCRTVRCYMEQQPAAWSETFEEALGKYRRAASRGLQAQFARAVT